MTEWLASQLTLKYKAGQSNPATAQRSQKAWISLLSQGHGSGVIFTVTWTIFTVSHRLFSSCHTLFLEPLLNLKHFEEKAKGKRVNLRWGRLHRKTGGMAECPCGT